ncbi:MAG: hypothetical protein ACUVT8_07910 [Armatimonadota bacterium]
MLFAKGQSSATSKKPSTSVVAALLVVVILAAGFMLFRYVRGSSTPAVVPESATGGAAQPIVPSPWEVPAGAPLGPPGAQSSKTSSAPSPSESGGPGAPSPGAQAPLPGPAGKSQAGPPSSQKVSPRGSLQSATNPLQMRQITVFERVNVSYPATWKIGIGEGNTVAIFTDGKATFEVRPPDPRATNAKEIALRAVKSLAGNASLQEQGQAQISGHDAYWITLKLAGSSARIVGVDSPTRLVLVEYTKGVPFAAYKHIFDQMEAGILFTQ